MGLAPPPRHSHVRVNVDIKITKQSAMISNRKADVVQSIGVLDAIMDGNDA
jgi:hypothetical protein